MSSSMVVCCMCGDVGFADKLFRCSRCTSRFQHSYCRNYYSSSTQSATPQINICDWCRYEESNSSSSSRHQQSATPVASKRSSIDRLHHQLQVNSRSEYSSAGNRAKQHDPREENKGKQAGVPSPRTATKRYKLLKDVMC